MKRTFSILFSIYFLLLSIGIGVSTHLCGGREVNTALFVEAQACGHAAKTGCDSHADDKKGCCDHKYELIKLEGQYFSASDIVVDHKLTDLSVLSDMRLQVMPVEHVRNVIVIPYFRPPPNKISTRLALLQSYRC